MGSRKLTVHLRVEIDKCGSTFVVDHTEDLDLLDLYPGIGPRGYAEVALNSMKTEATTAIEKALEAADRANKDVELVGAEPPVITRLVSDPCPECGAQLKDKRSGGVCCPSCAYWFCF